MFRQRSLVLVVLLAFVVFSIICQCIPSFALVPKLISEKSLNDGPPAHKSAALSIMWVDGYTPGSIAFDKKGNVYVYAGADTVFVFTPEGNLIKKIELQISNTRMTSAIAIHGDNLFISMPDNTITVFKLYDNDDNLVSDLSDSELDRSFGRDGKIANNSMKEPGFISIYADKIYVLDNTTSDIYIFNKDGSLVGEIKHGENTFDGPVGMAIDKDGNVFIVDFKDNSIKVLIRDNTGNYSLNPNFGEDGKIINPFSDPARPNYFSSVAVDGQGNIVATSAYGASSQVLFFNPDGKSLNTSFGNDGVIVTEYAFASSSHDQLSIGIGQNGVIYIGSNDSSVFKLKFEETPAQGGLARMPFDQAEGFMKYIGYVMNQRYDNEVAWYKKYGFFINIYKRLAASIDADMDQVIDKVVGYYLEFRQLRDPKATGSFFERELKKLAHDKMLNAAIITSDDLDSDISIAADMAISRLIKRAAAGRPVNWDKFISDLRVAKGVALYNLTLSDDLISALISRIETRKAYYEARLKELAAKNLTQASGGKVRGIDNLVPIILETFDRKIGISLSNACGQFILSQVNPEENQVGLLNRFITVLNAEAKLKGTSFNSDRLLVNLAHTIDRMYVEALVRIQNTAATNI